MKITFNIETNDHNQEYAMGPYGERELPRESEIEINIKNNPSYEDIEEEVQRRLRKKEAVVINHKVKEIKS